MLDKKGNKVIVEGWAGKPKGLRQVLWERRKWKAGMVQKIKVDDSQQRDRSFCMQTVLHQCPDFNTEPGALHKLIHDRGHILLMSPKGHPEIAGLGVEYDWGCIKKVFRRINDQVAKKIDLHIGIALDSITMDIARNTARRARMYMRAYATGKAHSHELIEKFVKVHRTHRNILDQDVKYLDTLVALCQDTNKKLQTFLDEAAYEGISMYDAGGNPMEVGGEAEAGAVVDVEDDDTDSIIDPLELAENT